MQRVGPNLRVSQNVWLINTPRGSLQGRCRREKKEEERLREKEEGGEKRGREGGGGERGCDHQCERPFRVVYKNNFSFLPEFLPPSS